MLAAYTDLRNVKINGLVLLVTAMVLVATELGRIYYPLRLLKYTPSLLFLPLLIRNKLYIKRTYLSYVTPLMVVITYNILRFPFGIVWLELAFMFSAIAIFLVHNNLHLNLKYLNVLCFLAFIAVTGFNVDLNFGIGSFLRSETSTGESNMLPFLFGLFYLFFLIKKNYLLAVLNLFFIILSFKRIVFLGIFSCSILYFTRNIFLQHFINRFNLIAVNISLIVFFIFLSQGLFDSYVEQVTGLSIGHLTQGRSSFFSMVYPTLEANFNKVFFFGLGQGNLVAILSDILGQRMLFHNDVFKLFVENGFLIFFLFFYFLYRNKSYNQIIVCIFLNILMISDNILIYTPVLLLFFIILTSISQHEGNSFKRLSSASNS